MTGECNGWFNAAMRLLYPLATLLLMSFSHSSQLYAADYSCSQESSPPAMHEGEHLRVASLNIAHGRGDALNQLFVTRSGIAENLDRAADLLSEVGANILALQELDVDSAWSGNFNHADYLLRKSPYECMAVGIHATNWIYNFGTALLSDMQMNHTQAVNFEPTPPTTNKGMTSGPLLWGNGELVRPVQVVSVHLDFSRKAVRRNQLGKIIEAIQATEEALIIMGDFNEEWDNEESVVQALVNEAGMQAFQPESGDHASYKDKRLDWILISEQLEFTGHRVITEQVSDHRLVVAEVRWREAQ